MPNVECRVLNAEFSSFVTRHSTQIDGLGSSEEALLKDRDPEHYDVPDTLCIQDLA